MIIHTLIQGSPEWLAYRAQHFNASDAPAMMGVSPYKTRAELLREMHTGMAAEVDAATQRRFDAGHRAEALARPLAEAIIEEELYPVTGSNGRLSASFDGLTMAEDVAFEHKSLNAEIRAAFDQIDTIAPQHRDEVGCRELPLHYRVQMEQQLHVSGAERVLFMASSWDAEGNLAEELHCWYYPDAELRAAILKGWDQFAADLAAYVPPAPTEPAQADEPATLKLGTICDRLGFRVSAEFLADTLHIPHRATDKRSMLYRESDWLLICQELSSHVSAMGELYSKA